jgi:tetratricopeptide (TPR) repeat protein
MTGLAFVILIPALAGLSAQENAQPVDPAARYRLGFALGKAGDFAGAEKEFRAVLKLRPEDAEAHFNLGLTLIGNPLEKLDWSGAMVEFRAALKYKPGYIEARRMLAECMLNTGDPSAAVSELESMLKTNPDYVQGRFSLACALDAASRTDEAIGELRRVVQKMPDSAEPHAVLGKLLGRVSQNQQALSELEKSLRINPDLADAHLALASILRKEGLPGAGVELAQSRRLARRQSDAIRALRLSNRGLDAAASGDISGALALLRQSVEIRPDYAPAHYNLGLLLADSSDLPGAATELRASASLGPTFAKPWYSLGRVLEKSDDPDSALGALERAVQLDPEDGRAESLAQELRAKGAKPRRPQVKPDTALGHNAAGVERGVAGDWLGATGEFLRALEIQPDFVDARFNLAKSMYQRNQRDDAELELRKVLLLRSDAAAHYALGVVLKDKGDAGAQSEFETALKLDPSGSVAFHETDLMRQLKSAENTGAPR